MELNFDIIVLVSVSGLVLLALGLSLIPVRLKILLNTDVRRLRVEFWKLTIIDSDRPRKSLSKKSAKAQRESSRSKSDTQRASSVSERWSRFLKYLEIAPKLAKALLGFAIRLVRKLRIRDVRGSVSGGFADPADTGMAFGALHGLLGAVPRLQPHFQVKPDYLAERMEYSLRGEIALRPIALLGPTFRLVYELPKRELLRIARGRRQSRKRRKLR
jgi:Protein of unknown function (DUF2953)